MNTRATPASLAAAFAAALLAAPAAIAQKPVPTPESSFGFPVGADHKLFTYEQSIDYFRKLASASKNIRLMQVGTTSFGRAWTIAVISSEDNLKKLDKYRAMNMKLAHPDGLSDAEARKLAHDGKIIVDISGGLHASEIAGSQHTPLLAYQLLSSAKDPATKEIFDNVIFVLWPSINPDGQDIVVENCNAREAGQNTPMELYQKYVGHDNNRDSYMLNVIESRVIQRTWREWEPDIVYVHHQSSPEPTRIWIPPFADPVGFRAPPIPARQINTIGMFIAQELEAHNQPGAVHMLATYDAWYPGYIDYMPVYQNIPSWWTETQGGNCAIPKPATSPSRFDTEYKDLQPRALYLSPWTGAAWTLRDAVDYMVTASKATLAFAAKHREELLYNRYQSGHGIIEKYRTSAPYAYVVPQSQRDPMAAVGLLQRMAFMGVRVSQADRDVTIDGKAYPKGTWVIPMDQEFAELVRELFEVQHYPDMGDDTPYDAAGWTLPFQTGVNVVEANTKLGDDVRAALKPVQGTAVSWRTAKDEPFATNAVAAGIVAPTAVIAGDGDQLALDPAQNNSFRLINRALAAGGRVKASTGGPLTYVMSGVPAAQLQAWATELGVSAQRTNGASATANVPTRIALYKAGPGNMDEGWSEWLLDTYGYKYTLVSPADLQAGNLNARFDVIVFASQGPSSAGRGGRGGGRGGAAGGGRGGAGRGGQATDSLPDDPTLTKVNEFVRAGGTALFWNGGATQAVT
ncbi:MAG TPA: M14 metallopeptidase family protein, partial [Gemmatimonadaceae bacterium]|nr:M14 metallopeptidase family protein [Gemmatimonadaceae bacterium]